MTKILMVCMGNICRSPMAQAVVQHLALGAGLSKTLAVASAGTHANMGGEPADPRAQSALLRRGYGLGRFRSRKVSAKDFDAFDLILAMDADNLAELRRLCPPQHEAKLKLFMDFAEGAAPQTEVPDPYYGNPQGFEHVLDLCEAGAKGVVKHYTV